MDTMDAGMGGDTISIPHVPEMKIRGFADARAYLVNQNLAVIENTPGSPTPVTQGGNSTFALRILDLFVTSQISEHFSFLSETRPALNCCPSCTRVSNSLGLS
jgi:hypothetical protein